MSEIRLVDIPWNKFVRFLVERDVEVIGGEENADRLFSDWVDSISNLRIKNIVYLENKILEIKNKVEVSGLIVDAIKINYDERLASMLREWFESYELTIETYLQDIICIESECALMVADYELYLSEIEKLTGSDSTKEQTHQERYQYYSDLMKEVSKMPNVGYLPFDMDTQRWASYIKDYFALIDNQKLNQNGTRPDR